MRPRLVIMLKAPVAGRVKTRLGREIGMTTAAWWFRHQSAALIRRLQSPLWETLLFVTPDTTLQARFWPAHLPRLAQGRGGLGARMRRGLNSQPGPVVLIGGDIPDIRPVHIRRAIAALGQNDLVFGPATDGGFWLVATKKGCPRGLFSGVTWSCDTTLAQTVATAGQSRVGFIDTLSDIDTAADLKRRRQGG